MVYSEVDCILLYAVLYRCLCAGFIGKQSLHKSVRLTSCARITHQLHLPPCTLPSNELGASFVYMCGCCLLDTMMPCLPVSGVSVPSAFGPQRTTPWQQIQLHLRAQEIYLIHCIGMCCLVVGMAHTTPTEPAEKRMLQNMGPPSATTSSILTGIMNK